MVVIRIPETTSELALNKSCMCYFMLSRSICNSICGLSFINVAFVYGFLEKRKCVACGNVFDGTANIQERSNLQVCTLPQLTLGHAKTIKPSSLTPATASIATASLASASMKNRIHCKLDERAGLLPALQNMARS